MIQKWCMYDEIIIDKNHIMPFKIWLLSKKEIFRV